MDATLLAEQLTLWIRDETRRAGREGVVLGMSGGLDSSVTAVLCRQAMQNTLGVIMPCYSALEDREDAQAVAGLFSIATDTVALDPVFDLLATTLLRKNGNPRTVMARANLKARLRMLTLYYFANRLNYLVVGSGNRSELSAGYFTKYGDGGVDILPLGNLVKKQVRELALILGIPQRIIDKPPSAGLWTGQTDEAEMGVSYENLDRFLLTGDAPKEAKEKIQLMIQVSSHKRALPPIPAVTSPHRRKREVVTLHCSRCQSDWIPRDPDKEPTVCPRCHTPYWKAPRRSRQQGTRADQGVE